METTYPIATSEIKHVWNKYDGIIHVLNTKNFRCPKKGEWFISGAIPEGYLADNDLDQKYYIAKLVRVKFVTQTIIEEFLY